MTDPVHRSEEDPAILPAQPGMPGDIPAAPEPAEGAPPLHSANGHGAAYEPDIAGLIGASVAAALSRVIPQALAGVLAQVPLRVPQLKCLACVTARVQWMGAHPGVIEQAAEAAQGLIDALPPGDPRREQVQLGAFLPPEYRPGGPDALPEIAEGMVMAGGEHRVPGAHPGDQPARTPGVPDRERASVRADARPARGGVR